MRISDWSSDVCSSDLTAGALVGAPTVDQIGHLTAILVAESIDVDGPAMLTEKRKDGSHVSGNVPVNDEQVSQREVSPMVAVPPCEEKIRDAGRLAGLGASKGYQAVKRGLPLGVSENYYLLRFGSYGQCIKTM